MLKVDVLIFKNVGPRTLPLFVVLFPVDAERLTFNLKISESLAKSSVIKTCIILVHCIILVSTCIIQLEKVELGYSIYFVSLINLIIYLVPTQSHVIHNYNNNINLLLLFYPE